MNSSRRGSTCRTPAPDNYVSMHDPYPTKRWEGPPIDIAMKEPPTEPVPPWIRVHVMPDLDLERDVTTVDGIPCTTVERTIVDCAESLHEEDIMDVICAAWRRGLLDVARLREVIARVQHGGAARTEYVLDRWLASQRLS